MGVRFRYLPRRKKTVVVLSYIIRLDYHIEDVVILSVLARLCLVAATGLSNRTRQLDLSTDRYGQCDQFLPQWRPISAVSHSSPQGKPRVPFGEHESYEHTWHNDEQHNWGRRGSDKKAYRPDRTPECGNRTRGERLIDRDQDDECHYRDRAGRRDYLRR